MKASTEVARILELPPPGLLQRGHLDATSGFPKVRCPHAGELNGWTLFVGFVETKVTPPDPSLMKHRERKSPEKGRGTDVRIQSRCVPDAKPQRRSSVQGCLA
ncbi:hypothetical protein Y1Q_0014714 [Alligator mississippiensis]|uniref:Uncharacterized protein n=1 Tax=Alligator mississippiensis TaxID=8496 RepID=A0A151P8C0_ALLMI|nr:hypothetical protein Y1Q_0014714 [Alligator mississippiensis]